MNATTNTPANSNRRSGVNGSRAGSGDGIVAAGVERMTSRDPPDCEPAPAQRSMLLERFDCVSRTRWIITAGCRQQRRDPELVEPNPPDERVTQDARDGAWPWARWRRRVRARCWRRGRGRGALRGHHLSSLHRSGSESLIEARGCAIDACSQLGHAHAVRGRQCPHYDVYTSSCFA